MTYKERSRARIDKHIRRTQGNTRTGGRDKGRRADAWKEIKAFEMLVKATKEG